MDKFTNEEKIKRLEILYNNVCSSYRYYLRWREIIFVGNIAIAAFVFSFYVATISTNSVYANFSLLMLATISWMLLIVEQRNLELLLKCSKVGAEIELSIFPSVHKGLFFNLLIGSSFSKKTKEEFDKYISGKDVTDANTVTLLSHFKKISHTIIIFLLHGLIISSSLIIVLFNSWRYLCLHFIFLSNMVFTTLSLVVLFVLIILALLKYLRYIKSKTELRISIKDINEYLILRESDELIDDFRFKG